MPRSKRYERCKYCNKEFYYITNKGEKIAVESRVTRFVSDSFDGTGFFINKSDGRMFFRKLDQQVRLGNRRHGCIGIKNEKATASANA